MIELTIQIRLITFSFIFGFFFSIGIEIFNKKIIKYKKTMKFFLSLVFTGVYSFIYLEGIKRIGNAIFHIYSIITIILGFITYDILIKLIENNNKK